jgi:hypothetical protein
VSFMNCQEFWSAVNQVATPPSNHEHLAQCPACTARLRRQLALQKGLRAVAGQSSRIEAPARVEARLRAAFRAQAGIRAGGSQSARTRAWWIPVFTWIPATAALIALAVFLIGGRQPELISLAGSRAIGIAAAGVPAEIETEGGASVAESGENGFIPLPNAAQIGPNEEVNLVRVEVPRSAMIALGYDIKPEEASGSVQADVMLGNDGLARAVRFVD